MYEIIDTHGAPQCGVEITSFETYDDMTEYIDSVDGLYDRLAEGYALLREVTGGHIRRAISDQAAAVELMDDDLREEVHRDLAPCTWEEFAEEYARRHLERFGEEFAPLSGGAW